MIRTIIVALLAFVLIALLAIWVLSGGPRKVYISAAESITQTLPSSGAGFKLPWQPAQIFPTLDITDVFQVEDETIQYSPQEQLARLEEEYDSLSAQAREVRTFGEPSPYSGHITLMRDLIGVRADSPQDEYVQIVASYANTAPVDITGWILESALSGTRVAIPPGASLFLANTVNPLEAVTLHPGGLALVSSDKSPTGVSFRENMCSGYLGQFQPFSPPLSEECPSPTRVLPLTEENLVRYGEDCFDALASLPSCRFPQVLDNVSGACKAYLSEFLSYNGCVESNRFRSTFPKNMWRLFIGSPTGLWRNSHDAIRLLDTEGRTVSVLVY